MILVLLGCNGSSDDPTADGPDTSPDTAAETSDTGDTLPYVEVTATVSTSDNERMVLEKRFAITLSGAARVILTCTSPDDPLEDHQLELEGTGGEIRLYGLLPATAYDCVLSDIEDVTLWTGSFETLPLPEGLPEFVVTGDAALASIDTGYVLFSHWKIGTGESHAHRLVAMDGSGQVRWYKYFEEAATGGIAATWLGEEMVLGGGGVYPSLQNLSGDVMFEVGPPLFPNPADDVYHHEAQLTSAGILSLQLVPDTEDGVNYWNAFRIEVTDPATSEVVWSFDSVPARIAGLLPPGTPQEEDPYHANAVAWRDDDPLGPSVWVSLRAMEALMRIDRTTGELSFVGPAYMDLYDLTGAPAAPEEWFWGQHAPQYLGDEILVYDNGGSRPDGAPRYSRVAMFRRESADRMTLLWDWSEPGWFEPNFGMASQLANGHVLVTTGHCPSCSGTGGRDANAWILELDPVTGSVVWRFDFTTWNDSTYRSQAVDGCDLFANRRFCPEP